jgi:hypothetical protein
MTLRHSCQVSTAVAVRLQILDGVLDTPRHVLVDRFSDKTLQELEDEAHGITANLQSQHRCRGCGQPLPTRQLSTMSAELAYVWGS